MASRSKLTYVVGILENVLYPEALPFFAEKMWAFSVEAPQTSLAKTMNTLHFSGTRDLRLKTSQQRWPYFNREAFEQEWIMS